jgi:thiamine-phosphate pyrophosphorylase
VIGERFCAGRSPLDVLEGVIRGGAKIVQLREKQMSLREICRRAEAFREATARAGVLLIVNDRVDVALAVDADGVHLGQDDLSVTAARRIAPDLLIGVSTHSLREAVDAREGGADYVNVGPIFPTNTKEGLTVTLGPDAVKEIGGQAGIPFTVMGGIKEDNISEVLVRGARKVAVVTAVTEAADISRATRSLVERIRHEENTWV